MNTSLNSQTKRNKKRDNASRSKLETLRQTFSKETAHLRCKLASSTKKFINTKYEKQSADESNKSRSNKNISSQRTIQVHEADALPDRLKCFYERKRSENYTEMEKKRAQTRKQQYANKVGFQMRGRHHRHPHQRRREQQLLNFMNGLPVDYNSDSDDSDYRGYHNSQ